MDHSCEGVLFTANYLHLLCSYLPIGALRLPKNVSNTHSHSLSWFLKWNQTAMRFCHYTSLSLNVNEENTNWNRCTFLTRSARSVWEYQTYLSDVKQTRITKFDSSIYLIGSKVMKGIPCNSLRTILSLWIFVGEVLRETFELNFWLMPHTWVFGKLFK